jgi:hypothetical protein
MGVEPKSIQLKNYKQYNRGAYEKDAHVIRDARPPQITEPPEMRKNGEDNQENARQPTDSIRKTSKHSALLSREGANQVPTSCRAHVLEGKLLGFQKSIKTILPLAKTVNVAVLSADSRNKIWPPRGGWVSDALPLAHEKKSKAPVWKLPTGAVRFSAVDYTCRRYRPSVGTGISCRTSGTSSSRRTRCTCSRSTAACTSRLSSHLSFLK